MLIATDIKKSYHGEPVLKGISLRIEDGEFVSIMGESGSGKSTLLSILGGFLAPDSGEVTLDGERLDTAAPARLAALRCSSLGFVFQFFRLVPTLTVRENILLPTTLGRRAGGDTPAYLRELCKRLSLEALLSKHPTELSGGQCQRVAIARALLYRPRTVILDEPTGALDSENERTVMALLTEINRRQGTTILQVTHSRTVADYGGRLIRIADGVIVE
jgi:ABC-type lipoprotein export system ATPase subunit